MKKSELLKLAARGAVDGVVGTVACPKDLAKRAIKGARDEIVFTIVAAGLVGAWKAVPKPEKKRARKEKTPDE